MSQTQHSAHTTWNNRYHFVWITKYRRKLFTDEERCKELRTIIEAVGARYEFTIDELATDGDHVHAFIGAAPRDSESKIMDVVTSLSARLLLEQDPKLREALWGAELWGEGFFARTVGKEVTENVIREYIKNQGKRSKHSPFEQLRLF